MAITLDEAKTHLNIPLTYLDDDTELELFVDAANEWIAAEVTDDTTAVARLATRMLVAHWWQTQRGPAGGSFGDDGDGSRGAWFSIPNKVRELLQEKHAAASTPQGSFPDAVAWPDSVEYQS